MEIRVTNKNHPFYGDTYEVFYNDNGDYVIKSGNGTFTILKQDCEVLK